MHTSATFTLSLSQHENDQPLPTLPRTVRMASESHMKTQASPVFTPFTTFHIRTSQRRIVQPVRRMSDECKFLLLAQAYACPFPQRTWTGCRTGSLKAHNRSALIRLRSARCGSRSGRRPILLHYRDKLDDSRLSSSMYLVFRE